MDCTIEEFRTLVDKIHSGFKTRFSATFIVKSIIEYIKENVDETVGEHMIKHVTDRKGHDRRYGIDPQKIKDELGWYPETCFEVGIKKTIKWYLDNKEWFDNVTSGAYQKYYDTMYSAKEEI